jgi:hypothetical protein
MAKLLQSQLKDDEDEENESTIKANNNFAENDEEMA